MHTLARFVVVMVALAAGCEPPVPTPPPPTPTSVALFDPLGSPPVVPTPNDLAFVGGDGTHLNVPDQPTDSPAQRALNAYLRRLNGFPATSSAAAPFSAPLDATTVSLTTPAAPGSIVLLDTTTLMLLGPNQVTPSLSADGKTLLLTPSTPFTPGHRYAVLLFGGIDAAGLRGAAGEEVIAAPTFFFLRSPNPLVGRCSDAANPDCACPAAALADPTDTSCHSVALGLSDAQARQAEPQRIMLQTALMTLLPTVAPGRDQNDLVVFWTFTISTQPFTVFDPTSGNIPFPNDVLIDQMTGRVNLPIAAGDPMAPIKMALNTLDGFSVSAPETIGVTGPAPVDAKTLVPNRSVILLNLTPRIGTLQPEYSLTTAFNQIVVTPTLPLDSDQNRYAVVVTNGVSDTSGQALLPAAPVWLLTGPDPLFDGTHSTVSVLGDAQAQQLEALRTAIAPLVQQLAALGISREAIAGLWTFTTQSITRPAAALDAFPAQATLSTDVTLTKIADQTALAAAFGLQNFLPNVKYLVIGTFTSRSVVDQTTGLIGFTRSASGVFTVQPPATAATTTIHFWLALPNATGAVPIAFVQHGLGSWRGDVLPLANALAQQGWASIGFDIDYHGARSKCTADSQCQSGTCNVTTGVCSGGFKPTPASVDPLACDLAAVTADTNDCRPTISGQGYINPSNLLFSRTNGQQYIVDAAQVVRILADTTNTNGLAAKLAAQTIPVTPTVDLTKLGFLGQSLGAIDGSLFVAAAPEPKVGVLNVGGGHLFDLIANSPAFTALIDQYLMSIGVMRGTAAYAQLAATAAWVLDPADPWSIAPSLRSRPVIVQEAGMDMVILPVYEEALAQAIFTAAGLDAAHHAQGRQSSNGAFVSTYFPTASHGELLSGSAVGVKMVTQAIGFLASFGALLPAP